MGRSDSRLAPRCRLLPKLPTGQSHPVNSHHLLLSHSVDQPFVSSSRQAVSFERALHMLACSRKRGGGPLAPFSRLFWNFSPQAARSLTGASAALISFD